MLWRSQKQHIVDCLLATGTEKRPRSLKKSLGCAQGAEFQFSCAVLRSFAYPNMLKLWSDMGFNVLDTVEVIGSIPVAPIGPFFNHIKSVQPFNSPSLTPALPQFGNNSGTIRNVQSFDRFSLRAGRHMRVDFQRDSRVRVPELGLDHGNRNSEICEQTAMKMPEPVSTHARNTQPATGWINHLPSKVAVAHRLSRRSRKY